MVDEYLDEREQAEQLKRWFKENWLWLVAGIGLGLGGLYGWQGWNSYLDGKSRQAEAKFSTMLEALDASDRARADALADDITRNYGSTPYADQVQLVLARVDVEEGKLEQAAGKLKRVMDNSGDPELALVARLRLARVQSAHGDNDAALATLAAANAPAVEPAIAEVRGDVLLAKGDRDAAATAYREALAGAESGLVDAQMLKLKIDELASEPPAGQATAGKPAP
jgi:predicted negative regulator of RcsB-dependent stress response